MPKAEVQDALRLRFDAQEFALGAEVAPERLIEALRTLRDQHGYHFYICATATDRPEHFEVIHGLRNTDTFEEFWVKTKLPKEAADGAPSVESAALVYAGADWHEREILDLFGVSFRGHPDPRRILMPEEYEGHPLRKDFPIDTPWGYRPGPEKEQSE